MKPFCAGLVTLLLGLSQEWCDMRIWFSIRLYGPIKALYLSVTQGTRRGHQCPTDKIFSTLSFNLNSYVSKKMHL